MAQTSSGMHVTASSSAPILAAIDTPATSTAAATNTDSRSARRMTVVSGNRNGNDWVGQLYQMVKVNVNGVVKNLMIPVESTKKTVSAGTGHAAATPGYEVSASPDRPDAIPTPQPLVKPNASNTKLVIVSQSRSLLGCNTKTSGQSSMSSSSSSSVLSPSSAGTSSVSSVQSAYGSPVLRPAKSHVSRAKGSNVNTPDPRNVIVGGDRLSAAVLGGSSVMATHVIQPVAGVNKHLVISGVQPVAGPATQTVATSAGVRFMTPVQLAGSEFAASRPPIVAQTVATSVAPLVTSLVAPQMRTVHVMSAPTAAGSPVRAPVAVGMPQSGTKQLVFTSTIPVLRPAQIANGTRIIQTPNTTNHQPVLVTTAVRPAGTPVVGTLATKPVPATASPRQFVVHNPQVQKPGTILQPVVGSDNMRTVVLTVPVSGPSVGKAVVVPRVIQPPKPRHVVAHGLPSIAPPQNTSPALNVNQVRPLVTVVRSPSRGAIVTPPTTQVTSVVPQPTRQATSSLRGATGSSTIAVTQPKPLANTGSNVAIPGCDSPHLKIEDVFSLQKGDARIPSPLPGGAMEPVRHGSGMQVPVSNLSAESPLPPKDSEVVVLASWNKDDYFSSDANDDSSDKTIDPCPLRKTSPTNRRTTRVHRRTYGKFFQDAGASLTGCRVSLRPLELNERTRVSASEFEAERVKFTPRSAKPLRRAAPRCFLGAADPRRGDSYTIDADGRSISAIFVTECVRLSHKKARRKRKKATVSSSPPLKLQKTTPTTRASPSLAKNNAPKWVNQIVTAPTPIAPKVTGNSAADKKLRYLMVKTNAGTFLVPITSNGGLLNGGSTNAISLPPGISRPVIDRMVTRQTTASGSPAKDAVKVAVKGAAKDLSPVMRTTSGSPAKDAMKVSDNDAAKIVSPVTRTTERRTQYVTIPSQMSANYGADAGRSLLSPRIKSEPLKPGYEDAIETPVPPKRVKMEFDILSNDAPACTHLPPPPSMCGLSNQDRITQLKLELKKQQEAVEALRRRRSDSLNVALSDTR